MQCSKKPSLDHLVGAREKRWGQGETKYFGRLEVDDQFELARLHNREIACFLSVQNTAGINANLMIRIRKTRPITHQSASFDRLAPRKNRGYNVAQC